MPGSRKRVVAMPKVNKVDKSQEHNVDIVDDNSLQNLNITNTIDLDELDIASGDVVMEEKPKASKVAKKEKTQNAKKAEKKVVKKVKAEKKTTTLKKAKSTTTVKNNTKSNIKKKKPEIVKKQKEVFIAQDIDETSIAMEKEAAKLTNLLYDEEKKRKVNVGKTVGEELLKVSNVKSKEQIKKPKKTLFMIALYGVIGIVLVVILFLRISTINNKDNKYLMNETTSEYIKEEVAYNDIDDVNELNRQKLREVIENQKKKESEEREEESIRKVESIKESKENESIEKEELAKRESIWLEESKKEKESIEKEELAKRESIWLEESKREKESLEKEIEKETIKETEKEIEESIVETNAVRETKSAKDILLDNVREDDETLVTKESIAEKVTIKATTKQTVPPTTKKTAATVAKVNELNNIASAYTQILTPDFSKYKLDYQNKLYSYATYYQFDKTALDKFYQELTKKYYAIKNAVFGENVSYDDKGKNGIIYLNYKHLSEYIDTFNDSKKATYEGLATTDYYNYILEERFGFDEITRTNKLIFKINFRAAEDKGFFYEIPATCYEPGNGDIETHTKKAIKLKVLKGAKVGMSNSHLLTSTLEIIDSECDTKVNPYFNIDEITVFNPPLIAKMAKTGFDLEKMINTTYFNYVVYDKKGYISDLFYIS